MNNSRTNILGSVLQVIVAVAFIGFIVLLALSSSRPLPPGYTREDAVAFHQSGFEDQGEWRVGLVLTNHQGVSLVRVVSLGETNIDTFARYAVAVGEVTNGTMVKLVHVYHNYSTTTVGMAERNGHSFLALPEK